MKRTLLNSPYFLTTFSLLFLQTTAQAIFDHSVVMPRSAGINAARDLIGWQHIIHQPSDCFYWSFAITPEYTRTFRRCELVNYMLGASAFTFSGSLAENRRADHILADYFGLPLDYKSCVGFDPVLSQFIMDFNFYGSLASWHKGLYFFIHAPIVHANWDLDLNEFVSNPGTLSYPAGYMAATGIARSNLPAIVEDVFEGTTRFGDMQTPIAFGKIFNREEKTHIADLQLIVGNDFYLTENGHAGINARIYFPTGTRICSQFLLDPVIGDAQHWQLGLGFSGHYDKRYDSCSWGFFLDANITHLCTAKSLRSYDFNKPDVAASVQACGSCKKRSCSSVCDPRANHGSRYTLLELIDPVSSQLFLGVDGPAAPNQYGRRLMPAINATTLCSKTNMRVQIDIVAKISWVRDCFEVDAGYNFWYRSAERLVCRQKFTENLYALKGDTQLYGFTADDEPIALNATQSRATLQGGQGDGNFVQGQQLQNKFVDNPIQAQGPDAATALFNITPADAAAFSFARGTIDTSNPARLLTDADINECSALVPRGLSHKLFSHVNFTWRCDECWVPYIGLGVDVEWAPHCKKLNSGFSQWGIWLKGGFGK